MVKIVGATQSEVARYRERVIDAFQDEPDGITRAKIITEWLEDRDRFTSLMRDKRDEALIDALSQGHTPASLASQVGMSKTHVVNVRHRYVRDIHAVVKRYSEFGDSLGLTRTHILVVVVGGEVTYMSPGYLEFFGERATSSAYERIHPEDLPGVLSLAEKSAEDGFGTYTTTFRMRANPEAEWLHTEHRVSAFTDPMTGQLIHIDRIKIPNGTQAAE